MRHKNEVKALIINFIEFRKNQLSRKPKVFRSDNGGEFVDSELESFFLKEGIRFETTVPNTTAKWDCRTQKQNAQRFCKDTSYRFKIT